MKVLLSAFACRPDKGSEPEVGWRWAVEMARHHEVTVLTQTKNREAIEHALADLPDPRPSFRYFDAGATAAELRARSGAVRPYYMWWQRAAREVVAALHAESGFDLLHHVTFASCRYTTAIWGHGVPSVWGPVGGMESVPWQLLPWRNPRALCAEVARNISNRFLLRSLARRAAASSVVLAATRETERAFDNAGATSTLLPTIGIDADAIPARSLAAPHGRLELLWVGKLIALKGLDLALHALAESGRDISLTFIGDGEDRAHAERLPSRLQLGGRVVFTGRQPHDRVLAGYPNFHALIFPSLHDSGGFAVLEAMANGLPVICLDCGGPAISVRTGCGVRVALTNRRQVIADLAAALRAYDDDRALLVAHGEAARAAVREHYDWRRKAEAMSAIYVQAASSSAPRRRET